MADLNPDAVLALLDRALELKRFFDPDEKPSFVGDDLAEGGLGIAIIRTIADELEIESKPGVRGSRLRFVKLLNR